ncbi:MAG: SDR family oxidoreductase [Acidobacteriota bacterium]
MERPERFFLTGCASGIGRHLADRLIAQGCRVMATDINLERLKAEAERGAWPASRVKLRRLDVRDGQEWEEAMAEAVAAFGGIDVVMNIAGIMQSEWVHQSTAQTIDRHVDINLKGVIHGTATASRQMLKQGHGHIINIASMAGLAPIPGLAVYSATKYACRGYSLAAALELRKRNIFVTTISPDAVDTPLLAPQEGVDAAALLFSSRHLLTVEDIGRVVIDHVLAHRPMEVTIPRWRGWVARLTNILPWLGFSLAPLFRWIGAKRQQHYFGG